MNLDFDVARARLAEAERRLVGGLTEEERREVLKARAVALARRGRRNAGEEQERLAETIVVRRGELCFAFPVDAVEEIRRVHVSALPHSTPVLRGLFQIRGRPYCLADLAPFFDAAPDECPEETLVAVVTGRPGPLGLRIDEVLGPRTLFPQDLDTGLKRRRAAFVRAVTRDLVHLVDVEELLSEGQIQPPAPGTTLP